MPPIWKRLSLWLALSLLLATLAPGRVAAQPCPSLSWQETRTRAFSFLYPAGLPLGPQIASQLGEPLDAEFNRFANLFETSLPLPISVRLYPTEQDYYCLNALAPPIPLGQTHSRVGSREIALIARNIDADPEAWQTEGLDALRYELAILFVQHVTQGKAPPGLLIGTGIYAQDPFQTFERRLSQTRPPTGEPSAPWRGLWESPDVIQAPDRALQAASIVAYLVDVYGWDDFLQFLQALPTAESWRAALNQTYPAGAGALEDHWRTFYPLYFQGRWRANALYALSLTPYEQLIEAGAYQAAADGLAEAIALLADLDQIDLLLEAERLNQWAHLGLQADALARQSRQAYLEGDYPAAIELARQAGEKYAALDDARNLQALDTIVGQAEEILALRAELAEMQSALESSGSPPPQPLIEIGSRLSELGDTQGRDQAASLLAAIRQKRQTQAGYLALGGLLLALLLLAHRILLARQHPPPEVELQYG